MKNLIVKNDWNILSKYTKARIGLGRTGISLPTKEILSFSLDHAKARDAVYLPLDCDMINKQLKIFGYKSIELHSKAKDRTIYLQRPDLGRYLDANSVDKLANLKQDTYDIAFVIADGLSSLAIHENIYLFMKELIGMLNQDTYRWKIAPISVVKQARVAIGDEIGEILNTKIVVVLIGERPGLSSPDSLGMYLTWKPKIGLNDSSRNCISNIRVEGLSYKDASNKALYLLKKSRELKLSGINLKERSENVVDFAYKESIEI